MEPVISRYLRAFHNATDRTFVPSEQSRRELRGRGFERTLVAGRGVDMVRFSPQHRDPALRLAWGAADGPVLLYVGRLAAEKNVTLALRAYRQVRETHRGARMIVAGDGPCAQALRRDFPDVRFLGSQTGHALAATYASADLFVFPSESETFGNVTLEALASGLPVVAFDHAAAGELVTHGVNGWLVSPADAEGFVAACCAMTDSLDASRSASRAARRSVASHHWNRVLRAFEHQLTDALHEAGRSRVAETVTARA
jgi:glycosyltransferase involved in cell wall biosynthesis